MPNTRGLIYWYNAKQETINENDQSLGVNCGAFRQLREKLIN